MAEVKRHRKEEDETRDFFAPLEREFYHHRLLLEMKERQALEDFSNDLIKQFWGIPQNLSDKQTNILLYILPVASRIVGNLKLTAFCFQSVLEEAFAFEYQNGPIQYIGRDDTPNLGDTVLGVDFIAGQEFDEGIQAVKMIIGPLQAHQIADYLQGGKMDTLLNWLCGYFIPIEWDLEREIRIASDNLAFELNNEKQLLGYALCL